MYRPSAFSPTFDCTVDFLTNNPIEINSSIGIDVLPLGGGYVLFESAYGGNCVFEYTSATAEGTTITLYCTAPSWAESNYYTDPTSPFSPIDSAYGTISRTITSADWNDIVDHVLNKNNPHDVSKSQIGLGNVDNTSDLSKPISNATQEALNGKLNNSGFTGNAVIITNSQGGAEATPQASGFNKPFSDTMPLSPSISGDEGTDAYISRSDHQHPSETFTISGISVLVGDWVYDGTHPSYPFKANISNASVTVNHTPIVVFSQECASLGIYAQVAETSSGIISIYSSEIPNDTTVVRTIVLIKEI